MAESRKSAQTASRSTPNPVVSANFAAALQARGMTQAQLAEEMNARGFKWRQQTVAKVKSTLRSLTMGEIEALDELLESNLLEGTGLQQMAAVFIDRWALVRSRRLIADIREAADELEQIVDILDERGSDDGSTS